MLFSSMIFIYIFLPILMIIYFTAKDKLKNYILLIFSLLFYAWGEPNLIWVMFFSIVINYSAGIIIDATKDRGIIRRSVLCLDIFLNIGILVYFKYFNFIIDNINNIMDNNIEPINIIMPIGISFFTFQALSYTIDVYRQEVTVQRNIYKLALYISFFPQLIAGPIVKYHDVFKQIEKREINIDKIVYGSKRFIIGLSKKIIIANSMGEVADLIFSTNINNITMPIAWIGALCYSVQLYFDFSGYSDMAIGLGKIFGFTFLENFNYPYISKSVTEFWRRWHISLGTWFKEYLYIPLGGNRKGKIRTYINLLIVFFVTGLWHGANWTFILWGLWHGVFLIIERILKDRVPRINTIFNYIYTLLVVLFGWVMFRSESVEFGIDYIKTMLWLGGDKMSYYGIKYYFDNKSLYLFLFGIIFATPVHKYIRINKYVNQEVLKKLQYVGIVALFLISTLYLAASTYNPFIYFRF